jgi:hypothetical protein
MYLSVSGREFESRDGLWAFPNITIEIQRILFSKYVPQADYFVMRLLAEKYPSCQKLRMRWWCTEDAQRNETRLIGHDKFAGTNVTTEDWKWRKSAVLRRSKVQRYRHQSTTRAHRDMAADRTNGNSFGRQAAIEELTAHRTDFGRFHRRRNTDPTSGH